jgi:hypothetical protein
MKNIIEQQHAEYLNEKIGNDDRFRIEKTIYRGIPIYTWVIFKKKAQHFPPRMLFQGIADDGEPLMDSPKIYSYRELAIVHAKQYVDLNYTPATRAAKYRLTVEQLQYICESCPYRTGMEPCGNDDVCYVAMLKNKGGLE